MYFIYLYLGYVCKYEVQNHLDPHCDILLHKVVKY